ncbi:MAG: DNA cytosine methyltransferase [Lactobacillus sp.]|nr:MAG: DNA cytosine methyltransferase [Lactobacillus sp.]
MKTLSAIDLFSGCGGLSEGLKQARIKVKYAVELDSKIAAIYQINHPKTTMINSDIKSIPDDSFLNMGRIDIVAGCPPCQGFTQMNRNNKRLAYNDARNELILEYLRVIKLISPEFIMMENVPEIVHYDKFNNMLDSLYTLGYHLDYKVVNVKNFGIPQSRKRLVLIGSKSYSVKFPIKSLNKIETVRDCIGKLPNPSNSSDPIHRIHSNHTPRIQEIIELIPKNGGNRKDLPEKYWLECHKKNNIGYSDVYGRMYWDKPSPTITGGCLSPSKGRFLHPEQNRSISVREASLLQTFPIDYKFNEKYSKSLLAQMIGNAIPPAFAKIQGEYIKDVITGTKTASD